MCIGVRVNWCACGVHVVSMCVLVSLAHRCGRDGGRGYDFSGRPHKVPATQGPQVLFVVIAVARESLRHSVDAHTSTHIHTHPHTSTHTRNQPVMSTARETVSPPERAVRRLAAGCVQVEGKSPRQRLWEWTSTKPQAAATCQTISEAYNAQHINATLSRPPGAGLCQRSGASDAAAQSTKSTRATHQLVHLVVHARPDRRLAATHGAHGGGGVVKGARPRGRWRHGHEHELGAALLVHHGVLQRPRHHHELLRVLAVKGFLFAGL